MEADLNRLGRESDTLTGRVDDLAVQRTLRQIRTRKPFPESLPAMKKSPASGFCCPECGGAPSYWVRMPLEQLELMRSAFQVIRTVRENMPAQNAMPSQAPRLRAPLSRVSPDQG